LSEPSHQRASTSTFSGFNFKDKMSASLTVDHTVGTTALKKNHAEASSAILLTIFRNILKAMI
jgi:hypothetical protein